MTSRTFALLRHGEKSGGFGDHGLTDEGERQAAALADALVDWHPAIVVSSSLARARETSAIICDIVGTPLHERVDLVERKVQPPPGGGRNAFRAEWARVEADRNYRSYSGESSTMAGDRLASALREIASKIRASRIAVVTHGGIIRDFVLSIREASGLTALSSLSASDIPLASGTIVTLTDMDFAISAVGLTGVDLTRELANNAERYPTR